MKKAAVIGYPVKHSLSPKLHGFWLEKYEIDGEYGMLEVAPDNLENTLRNLKENGYAGCNLTVPHKEEAYKIIRDIGEVTIAASAIGAVNTVYFNENGKLEGDNTDAYGFIQNIKENMPGFDFMAGSAVVFGAGGAARAVIAGLIEENVPQIIIINRTKEKAESIKKHFKSDVAIDIIDWESRDDALKDVNLLVNTTTLGMEGQPGLQISLHNLPKSALVTDIVYKPLETGLIKQAKENGNKVVDGLGMLLYQAVPGFKAWFGKKPDVTKQLREYILS